MVSTDPRILLILVAIGAVMGAIKATRPVVTKSTHAVVAVVEHPKKDAHHVKQFFHLPKNHPVL